jgi:hypothetical protein
MDLGKIGWGDVDSIVWLKTGTDGGAVINAVINLLVP